MVESVLEPYLDRIQAIHAILRGRRFANDVDTSGDYLQVKSRYESGTEMVAKAEIMGSYGADESIAIGFLLIYLVSIEVLVYKSSK